MEKSDITKWNIPWRWVIVGFICAIAAVVFIFLKLANPAEIMREMQDYPLQYLALALGCVLLAWVVDGIRIYTLSLPTGGSIPLPVLTITLIAANFLTLITPFAAGGAPLVIFMLYRHKMSIGQASGIVLGGGLAAQLGLFTLVSFVINNMPVIPSELVSSYRYLKIGIFTYGLVIISVTVFLSRGKNLDRFFRKYKNAETWIRTFSTTIRALMSSRGKYFLGGALAGMIYFGLFYLAGFFLLVGFDPKQGFTFAKYGLAVIIGVAPLLSPIPGGAGIAEVFSAYMLDEALPPSELGTFILIWRLVVFYIPVIVGGSCFAYLLLDWAKNLSPNKDVTEG